MKSSSQNSRIQFAIAMIILALFSGMALCEGVLQILFRLNPDFIIKKQGGGCHPADLIQTSPPLDYALTPLFEGRDIQSEGDFNVAVKINKHGFRDFPGEFDPARRYIMAVGDSIMYGEGVELEETFLALLEKQLQEKVDPSIQVIKAGTPGYGERQALDLLKLRYGLFKPKLVILGVTASESWRNINGYRNEQGFIVDSRLKKRFYRFGEKLYHSNFEWPPLAALDAWQEAHFLLPTFLRQRRKYLKEKFFSAAGSGFMKEQVFARTAEGRTKQTKNRTEIASALTGLAMTDETASKKAEATEQFPLIEATYKEIDRFYELSRELKFMPVILAKDYSIEGGKLVSDYAKKRGIPVLDLAPFFKAGEGQISYNFPHDGHWNASTHRMVSELLFNFLTNKEIVSVEN